MSVSFRLDHAVVAVPHLETAAARYEQLGFTLTPRGQHPWGTANRLVQFGGGNFIELLEIDRPALIPPHEPGASPPRFSFGAYNRDFLASCGPGMSMLALAGHDADADVARFARSGLTTYAPFHFERAAPLPGGRSAKVAFSLAFATHIAMPWSVFFTCHNKLPQNFWKPVFQSHANGAREIVEAVLVAPDPTKLSDFIAGLTGSCPHPIAGGLSAASDRHALTVLAPGAFAHRFGGAVIDLSFGPRLAALVIVAEASRSLLPARDAAGVTIAWQPG
jgi:hypothetical protein